MAPIQIARIVAKMRRRDGRGSSGVTIAWKDAELSSKMSTDCHLPSVHGNCKESEDAERDVFH